MTRARSDQESGRPGDGKGRRDEVGRTGIWPAPGPLPQSGASELATYRMDPVGGAHVKVEDAPSREYRSATYYFFDGEECRRRFDEGPERYAHTPDIRRPDVM